VNEHKERLRQVVKNVVDAAGVDPQAVAEFIQAESGELEDALGSLMCS
jgi:hypothetical protein